MSNAKQETIADIVREMRHPWEARRKINRQDTSQFASTWIADIRRPHRGGAPARGRGTARVPEGDNGRCSC